MIFGKRFVSFRRRRVFDAAMMGPLLKVADLHGLRRDAVLKSIALPGEIVCLVGSNGAGKTTLLRAISRSLAARGTLAFDDQDILPFTPKQVVSCGCPRAASASAVLRSRRIFSWRLPPKQQRRNRIELQVCLRTLPNPRPTPAAAGEKPVGRRPADVRPLVAPSWRSHGSSWWMR